MLKIAHLISSNGLFGAEKVLLNLALGINRGCEDAESHIVAIVNSHNPNSELIDAIKKEGLSVTAIESKGRFDLGTISRLYEIIKSGGISVLHTHNYKADLIGLIAAKKAKIPIVATLHGYIGDGFKLRIYEGLDRSILRYFDKVILVDDSMKKWFKNGAVRYKVINNGVDTVLPGNHVTMLQARVSLGIKENELLIGTVGRLSEEKGHKFLLEAFAKLIKDLPTARLMIVGDGILRSDLEDISAALGIKDKVTFTGFQSDVSRHYAGMDIYVSSSLLEHFPLSIMEAMSFSKAVVATNVGGTSDLIKEGVTGILIRPGSSEEIYQAIQRYIDDSTLRKSLGENARQLVSENYSLERMAESYKKIYQEVLS